MPQPSHTLGQTNHVTELGLAQCSDACGACCTLSASRLQLACVTLTASLHQQCTYLHRSCTIPQTGMGAELPLTVQLHAAGFARVGLLASPSADCGAQ